MGEFSPNGILFSLSSFFENYRSSPILRATFSTIAFNYSFCENNGLGYILGDFLPTHLVTLVTTPAL
jgi:hypothetical protein